MAAEEQNISLEEGMKELKEIVARMEEPDLPLEESFKLYEKGTVLLKNLNDKVDSVNAKVEKLNADGTKEPFLSDDTENQSEAMD